MTISISIWGWLSSITSLYPRTLSSLQSPHLKTTKYSHVRPCVLIVPFWRALSSTSMESLPDQVGAWLWIPGIPLRTVLGILLTMVEGPARNPTHWEGARGSGVHWNPPLHKEFEASLCEMLSPNTRNRWQAILLSPQKSSPSSLALTVWHTSIRFAFNSAYCLFPRRRTPASGGQAFVLSTICTDISVATRTAPILVNVKCLED